MRRLSIMLLLYLLSACNLNQVTPNGDGGTLQPLSTDSLMLAICDPTESGVVWFLYTAQVGETVDDVIQRMGTTREIVISGNCWTDIPDVTVGNQWYMPPASIDSLPNLDGVDFGGTLIVTPSGSGIGGTLSLLEPQVTLRLEDFPDSATSVFFYLRQDGEMIGIGTDADLTDGASTVWETVPNLTFDRAALAAVAYDSIGVPIMRTEEYSFNTT
jgi:hypothetical protein